MTEVKPAWIAVRTWSSVAPWSRWIATGTEVWCAQAMTAGMKAVPTWLSSSGWMATRSGASVSSLTSTRPLSIA